MVRTGERGDFLQKVPPSPPYPLSPSKTLIRENHRELLPRQGFPCPMVSRQGLRRTAFFLHAGGHVTSSTPVSVPNSSPLVIRFLPFCHAAGRPADEGRSARPDGLRSSRQSFLRDGWGRGGKRQHQKEKQYEMPAFFFLPCCRETGGQGTACETRRPTILPEKFFAGWMGGAGGRKGAFLQKSPLPSPRIPPAPF